MSASRRAALALLAVAACGCERGEPTDVSGQAPVAQAAAPRPDATERIATWLECEECGEGQLDAVVQMGEKAVSTLAAALHAGLSPAQRRQLELQLEERWKQRAEYEEDRDGKKRLPSQEAYVGHHLAAREALHRVRAATALGRIGGDAAITALRKELTQRHRPSVERAILEALGAP